MAPKVKTKPPTSDKLKTVNTQAPAATVEGPALDDLVTELDLHVKARDYKQALKVSEQSILVLLLEISLEVYTC